MHSSFLSQEEFYHLATDVCHLYVLRCVAFIRDELGISLDYFCEVSAFDLDFLLAVASGQFSCSVADLLRLQYFVEWFWSRSSVVTPFPKFCEVL